MPPHLAIHVFGNPDFAMDALPLRLLPHLCERFPTVDFIVLDPNEEWDISDPFIIIDTIVGLPTIQLFHSLDEFTATPTVSMHDFDALFNLRYLAKLGKLKRVRIIGIPPNHAESAAFAGAVSLIATLLSFEIEHQGAQ